MTKIDIFSGFLGAGKTTLIRKLIKDGYHGEKLVLIENEFGDIAIDGGFLKDAGIELMTVIDPGANISRTVRTGRGAYIARGALIQPDTAIGEMAIVNTGAVIEHNCSIGAYSHISSGAVLAGNVIVGDDTFIGAGSAIRQGIRIGNRCIIGAGSVVVKDIPEGCTAYGNPCRIRKGDKGNDPDHR